MQKFSKFHGAGNDFILIEDFEKTFPRSQVTKFCDRRLGIGADGFILAQHSAIADYKMLYFNADGSSAAMCGNGLRCFVHFLKTLGIQKSVFKIEVGGKILTVICKGSKIITFLPLPHILHWDLPLLSHRAYVVDTGVPHIVIFAKDGLPMLQERIQLEQNANVNFAWVDREVIQMRTYERGVGETLACGTGAAAVAFVAHQLGFCERNVKIATRLKHILEVGIENEISILGPSVKVFDGYFF